MKRTVHVLLLALTIGTAIVIVEATPLSPTSAPTLAPIPTVEVAEAGDGFWSRSGCDGGRRANEGWWWGVPGEGSNYWWNANPGQRWVGGIWYQIFKDNNHECGPFGWPVSAGSYDVHERSPLYYPGEWLRQDFELLSMNYYRGQWYWCDDTLRPGRTYTCWKA